ncbi:MAG: synthase subunit [Bacteroidota bacterium]
MLNKNQIIALFTAVLLFFSFSVKAEGIDTTAHEEHKGDAASVVVEHIMNHIADANENHLGTIGEGENEKHISLPLPCIIYNKTTGSWSMFMSSVFHHAADGTHDGYKMMHGRVVDAQSGDRANLIDLSITKNVLNMLLGFLILTLVFFAVKKAYDKRPGQAPKGLQGFIEPFIVFLVEEIAEPNIGKQYQKYLPYLITVFFFILINNLLGLIPFLGSINSSGNISFTLVLSICTLLVVNINGNKHYWQHIFAMPGVPKWVLLILTPVELMGVLLKPVVLMLRLFGNISGGHITVLAITGLIFIMGDLGKSVAGATTGGLIAFPILLFVNALELFVAFLQAYIFTLLSAIYIGSAIEEHHAEEHH